MSLPEDVSLPGLKNGEEVRFSEPWQAQVFALTVSLSERGAFSWTEWAEVFSKHLASSDAADDASDYFHHWIEALVELLESKDITEASKIAEVAAAWKRAAEETPHGQPIELNNSFLIPD